MQWDNHINLNLAMHQHLHRQTDSVALSVLGVCVCVCLCYVFCVFINLCKYVHIACTVQDVGDKNSTPDNFFFHELQQPYKLCVVLTLYGFA